MSGANVNVGSDLLPGSTERCVAVNGGKDAVTQAQTAAHSVYFGSGLVIFYKILDLQQVFRTVRYIGRVGTVPNK